MVAKVILYILVAVLATLWLWVYNWAGSATLQAVLILFSIIGTTCFCKCGAK